MFPSDENYEKIFDKIRYPIIPQNNIPDIYSHKYMKIKTDLDDDLTLEKTLNVDNLVIIVKSVFNKKL